MMKKLAAAMAVLAVTGFAGSALADGDAAEGEKVYRKCKACHQVGEGAKNRVGPELNGVIGRTAGSVEGFKYSNAMLAKGEGGLVWDAETLSAFLEKPKDYVPQTKMSFAGLKSVEDRAAIAAYLASFGP